MQAYLTTERLILREILPGDDEGMFELDSDKEVHKYLGSTPFTTIEDSRKIISFIRDQYRDMGTGRLAVINKETKEFMGWAGLKLVKDLTNGHINYYDLGYRFMKRHWGNGYATEAAEAIIDYGFNIMKVNEIHAMVDANNMQSRKVLEKAGLSHVEDFDFQEVPHAWYKISNPAPA